MLMVQKYLEINAMLCYQFLPDIRFFAQLTGLIRGIGEHGARAHVVHVCPHPLHVEAVITAKARMSRSRSFGRFLRK